MDGRSACCIGESDELQAHFELQVRIGYGPLHIGLGDFDDIAISPECTAGCRTSPYLRGHLEGYEAFEVFRSNGPQDEREALAGCEFVTVVHMLSISFRGQPCITDTKGHCPKTANFEIDGERRACI